MMSALTQSASPSTTWSVVTVVTPVTIPRPRITERAAYLTGYPYPHIEPLQLVKYIEGQKYEPHFDYGEACDFEENMDKGHRHVTRRPPNHFGQSFSQPSPS